MTVCDVCSAPTRDSFVLCDTDAEELLTALFSVPALVEDLTTTFARLDQMRGPGPSIGKSTERPLPWNDRVPQRLDHLTEVLCRWARPVARERQLDALPHIPHARDPKDPARIPAHRHTAIYAARLLSDSWTTVRTLRYAGDAHAEIIDAIRQARRATDRPAELRYLGQCSAPLEAGGKCEADLYAHPAKRTVTCRACVAEHDVEQRRAVLREAMCEHMEAHVGTAAEVAGWLRMAGVNVGTSTVRRWGASGRMPVERRNGRGHPLYRVGAVREVFERLHEKRKEARHAAS